MADLFHVNYINQDTTPYTIPLGIGFLASTIKKRMPGMEVRLFRDPNRFVAAFKEAPPEVVGFTFTSWTMDLAARTAKLVKRLSPKTVTVAGGPCVSDEDSQIIDFLTERPEIDFVIPNEGENGILALLRHLERGGGRDGKVVAGAAYLDGSGRLVRGAYEMPVVNKDTPKGIPEAALDDEVPSPILDGTLDAFLEEGLTPILQTMRGCPYGCGFCVSGMSAWNKMRGFNTERVKAEIDYVFTRGRSKDLILTDENFGILGERDVELARYLMGRYKEKGAPARLYYYTTKIVTDASRAIVETVAPIAWIGEFTMSFQSLNPEARKAIRRTNITLDKLASNIKWANERGIATTSEMIYGFPYETPGTYFDGIETLLKAGMSRVLSMPIQLFPGIDMASRKSREDFGLKTRFRLADNAYGIYAGGELPSVETEEVIVSTKWASYEDYLMFRRYTFFLSFLLGRMHFQELFLLCAEGGGQPYPIIRHLASMDYSAYPALKTLLAKFVRDANAELKGSREEVFESAIDNLRQGIGIEGIKLNLIYTSRLFGSKEAMREILDIIISFLEGMPVEAPQRDVLLAYARDMLPMRLVAYEASLPREVEFDSRFDYARWAARDYENFLDLLLPRPRRWVAVADDVLRKNLEGFDASSPAKLQAVMDHTPTKKLLRTIRAVDYKTGSSPRR